MSKEMYNKSLDLKLLVEAMQEYLNDCGSVDSPVGSMIEGHKGTLFSQATELFNDFVLYVNDGVMIEDLVIDPTTPNLGEGH
jgi:hypothetical protein